MAQAGGKHEAITIKDVRFHNKSNLCPVTGPLDFSVRYSMHEPLVGTKWHVEYILDVVLKRNKLNLGVVAGVDIPGTNFFEFRLKVPSIDVSCLPKAQVANVGLLVCKLRDSEEKERACLKMVVQVARTQESKEHIRCIYNPLPPEEVS